MTVGREDLERLTPEGLAGYLRSAGWRPADDLNGRATVWELDDRQVIVPASSRFRDYPQRVFEVIQALAAAEERTEPEVIRSLAAPGPYVDRPYVRLFPDAPTGMISAADAAEAFAGMKELFIAAAYAEYDPDAPFVLPNRKPRFVMEFPEKALVTTGPGSFVIGAQVTLPQPYALFPDGRTFERLVLLRLRGSLLGARAAAREAYELAELTPFTERPGVSKTLCRALARFGGVHRDRPFEVGFGWASAIPADVPDTPVRFVADELTMLADAAEDRETKPRPERAEIRGTIRTMHRPLDQRWVVVRGVLTIGGISRRQQVWVPLDPDDYDRALRAHGQDLQVRIAGTLTRTGRRTELRPTEYFRVL